MKQYQQDHLLASLTLSLVKKRQACLARRPPPVLDWRKAHRDVSSIAALILPFLFQFQFLSELKSLRAAITP